MGQGKPAAPCGQGGLAPSTMQFLGLLAPLILLPILTSVPCVVLGIGSIPDDGQSRALQ